MVSRDKRTWETRGEVPIADFAVSPDDAQVLLATTGQGLARSEDGGNTYTPVPAALPLLLVSWAQDGTIVGVDSGGGIHASSDGARTWERRGSLGSARTR